MPNLNFEELKQGYAQVQANVKKIAAFYPKPLLSPEELNSLEDWGKRLEQPEFNVLFLGGVNAGKSTMINALLGRTLLRAELKRTTVKATLIKKAQNQVEEIVRFDKNGQKNHCPLAQLDDLVNSGGNNDTVEHVEVLLNDFPFDADTVLVDSPGFDTPKMEDYKIIEEYLSKAHVCVICFDPLNIETVGYTNLVKQLMSNNALSANKILWVLNKWNNCTPKQQVDAENTFHENLIKNTLKIDSDRVYKISAGSYLGAQLSRKSTRSKKDDEMVAVFQKDGLTAADEQAFEKFRKELFDYLNETAKNDFQFNAARHLKILQDKLKDTLTSLPEYIAPMDEVLREEETQLRDQYRNKVYTEIEASKQNFIRAFKQKSDFFKEEGVQQALKEKITQSVEKLLDKAQLIETDAAFLNVNIPEIEAQLHNIEFPKILRSFIHTKVKELVYNQFVLKMTQEIKDKLALDKIDKQLDTITEPHLLDFRIRGFLDAILFNYELDALSRFPQSAPDTDKNTIPVVTKEAVLQNFKTHMVNYLHAIIQPITMRVWILTLNCFLDMVKAIRSYLQEERTYVLIKVPNEKIGMTGKAKLIQAKVAMIQDVLKTMKS